LLTSWYFFIGFGSGGILALGSIITAEYASVSQLVDCYHK
jgi:hypothetical protein